MGGMAIAGLGSIVSGGLGFLGSQNQANASRQASQQQAMLQMAALQQQQAQYAQNRSDLAPYRDIGQNAGNMLTGQLPSLTQPFAPTQQQLEQTPGYQFNLSQGLKATQSAAAARGLGVSGAALKGAANYATGLADNTLQTQFNIDQANKNNAFNKLYQTTGLGASAASGTALLGQSNANSQSSIFGNIGNANAAGTLGAAGANASGFNSLGNGINSLTAMYYANNRNGSGNMFSADNLNNVANQWNRDYG